MRNNVTNASCLGRRAILESLDAMQACSERALDRVGAP
jgi:hypothetical protein